MRIIDIYKGEGFFILFHCCGKVMDILEDLIELGVDILNPIQASANDLDELRQRTKGKIALYGGIDSDKVMRRTPDDVAGLTYEIIHTLGQEGDYIAFADQVLPFPEENLAAMEQVINETCIYPLKKKGEWKNRITKKTASSGRMITGS